VAYPGELEDVAYKDYVIEKQSNGEEALSKEEWRKRNQPYDQAQKSEGERVTDKEDFDKERMKNQRGWQSKLTGSK
jgi:hypothetical protein